MDLDKHGPIPTASGSDFVVCPECGSEFQSRIKACIDCGAATVSPEAARALVQDNAAAGPPDEDDEIVIREEELEWIKSLQDLLERNGIPSRIAALPSPHHHHRCKILVARQYALHAFALDREILRERLGEEAANLVAVPPPGICPLCGSKQPADAIECSSCGLVLGGTKNNLKIVQSLYEAFGAQDRERILEIFDPEIEWIQNEGFPGGGTHVGAERVLDTVFARLGAEWKSWQADVGRWLDADDSIVALGAYRGTHRKTGRSMTAAFAHVYWLDAGRVIRFEQYADTAQVVAACLPD